MDPIDRPDFNINTKREPNVETMARMRGQASLWRSAVEAANDERAKLNELILYAFDTGHSYRQMSEAAGVSIQVIQMTLAKAGRLRAE